MFVNLKKISPTNGSLMFNAICRVFCQDMLKAIRCTNKSNKPVWFLPSVGICYNFMNWMVHNHIPSKYSMKDQLSDLFDNDYPFNNDRCTEYEEESGNNLLYKNPARLAWLKKHAK